MRSTKSVSSEVCGRFRIIIARRSSQTYLFSTSLQYREGVKGRIALLARRRRQTPHPDKRRRRFASQRSPLDAALLRCCFKRLRVSVRRIGNSKSPVSQPERRISFPILRKCTCSNCFKSSCLSCPVLPSRLSRGLPCVSARWRRTTWIEGP